MATQATLIPQKEIEALREDGAIVVSQLRAIKVVDQDTCDMASEALQRKKAWDMRVEARFKGLKETARATHMGICQLEREMLALGSADASATRENRDAYLREIERQRRQREDAKIKAQREQEEQARADSMQRARDMGASKAAVKQIEREFTPMPAPVEEAAPMPQNTYEVTRWKWRPEVSPEHQLKAIVTAIAKSKDPNYNKILLGYLMINEKQMQATATGSKKLASVPGTVFYPDTQFVDKASK
jgi:hypothetical protein